MVAGWRLSDEEFLLDRFAERDLVFCEIERQALCAVRRSGVALADSTASNSSITIGLLQKLCGLWFVVCGLCRVSGRGDKGSGWAAFFDKNARKYRHETRHICVDCGRFQYGRGMRIRFGLGCENQCRLPHELLRPHAKRHDGIRRALDFLCL
jgi:hypothetical protein